ncbi:MAG: cytochrome c oxidase subunit II [Synechococcales cyanobacterium CRU_2_2]|nr:cytochrome c oxidase subunit II [Synechococcales cyanobacterium CRU_2_2]
MQPKTLVSLTGVAIAITLISYWIGQQSYGWLPPQASAESVLVDALFSFLVTIGAFVFLGVLGVLSYSVLFQRAGRYDFSDGPPIEGNVPLEIVWTLIPLALVMWIAVYSFQVYDQMGLVASIGHDHASAKLTQPAPLQDSLGTGALGTGLTGETVAQASEAIAMAAPTDQIEVYSRQWAWEFRYPGYNVSSTELHLPINRRSRLLLHSEDVIHGLFIPAFRVKQDIVPNEVTRFEFTPIREGRYRLRDSLYSGTYFAAMQTDVVVESPEAFAQWLATAAAQPLAPAYNLAYDEYSRKMAKDNPPGWPSVPPAAPPLVNYSAVLIP